jgi:hypothetical protein
MKVAYQASPQQKKTARTKAVERIIVTVEGIPFDGDEVSQTRLTRAAMILSDGESTLWMCADNVPRMVSKEQFVQALRLAGEEQTRLWFL